jgi:hypothetical protein
MLHADLRLTFKPPQCSEFFGSAQTMEEALSEPRALAVLEDVTALPLDAAWREKLLRVLKDVLLDDLIVDEQKIGLDRNAFALPADWGTLMELTNGLRGLGLPADYIIGGDDFLYLMASSVIALKRHWDSETPPMPHYIIDVMPKWPHFYYEPSRRGARSAVEELIAIQKQPTRSPAGVEIQMWDVITAWEIGGHGSNCDGQDIYVWYAYLRHREEKKKIEWKVVMWGDYDFFCICDNLIQHLKFLAEEWIPE